MRKIISFMHISLDGFVAGPNGEMNWIKVDEEIFDHVGKRINEGYNQPHWRPRQRQLMQQHKTVFEDANGRHYLMTACLISMQ